MLPGFDKSWRVELIRLAAQPFSQVSRQIVHVGFDLALDRSKDRHDFDLVGARGLNRLDDGLNGCAGSDGQYIAISQMLQQKVCRHRAEGIQRRTAALRHGRNDNGFL